jgi:CubicO group peptidase (beta-lactamase class C family)
MNVAKLIAVLALATSSVSALAQGLPKATSPEEIGISSQRLKRLSAAFQSDVDKGVIPGAVVLIARDGKVAFLRLAFRIARSEFL